jgi:hypothetical protein
MARSHYPPMRRWAVALALSISCVAQAANTVSNTVLVLARDSTSAASAYSGLQGYGIPYQVVTVPQTGTTLPTLNSTASSGNYGAIVVMSEVSYDFNGNFASALTAAQWQQLYAYQTAFGVRMVRLDVFPGPDFGCTALGGTSTDNPVSISNSSGFATAGLKM